MATIIDYLRWRGDLRVSKHPFNDVDNLILSALVYVDFGGIVPAPGKGTVSLGDACQQVIDGGEGAFSERVKSLAKVSLEFLEVLASSARFRDMPLHDYVDELDEERYVQFAAMQVDVSPRELYVAYRGTDESLVGWREDFMLTFTVPEAQRRAARYLEDAVRAKRWRFCDVYAGGHSKGGNLALYAAMTCPERLSRKIVRVWSNDGSGLSPEVMEESGAQRLGERYRRIVPSYDLVGIIFERDDDPRIVAKSTATGIGSHDIFSWEVSAFGIEEDEQGLTPESLRIKEGLKTWIEKTPIDRRGTFVDEFFDALAAGGAKDLREVFENLQAMTSVINAMGDMSEETKQMLLGLANLVISNRAASATSAAQGLAGTALRRARGAMVDLRSRSRRESTSGSANDAMEPSAESVDALE